MTKATREALLQVDRILHEAGWDEPDEADEPVEELTDMELSDMEHQLERLSVTPYWPELCRTIKEYYRKAYLRREEASPPKGP